jgi:hypothetical protein
MKKMTNPNSKSCLQLGFHSKFHVLFQVSYFVESDVSKQTLYSSLMYHRKKKNLWPGNV